MISGLRIKYLKWKSSLSLCKKKKRKIRIAIMEVQCSFTKVKDNLTEIDKKQVGNENEARASRTSKANLGEFNLTEEVKKLKILQR